MASGNQIRAGAAYIELFVKDSRLAKGLQGASQKLQAFGAGIAGIGSRLVGMGSLFIAPLLGAAKVFADLGSDLIDMSQRTGVSVEALSELGFAAEQSGADMDTLEGGLRKMQKFLVDAATGSKEAQKTLARLGLTVADLAKLAPDDQFKLIADRLSQVHNPTVRAALAMELFGKSGTKLLPLMSDGARGIRELQEQARRLGISMSSEDAQAADAFGDTLSVLWKVLKMGVFTIGSALAPALTELAQWISSVVKTASDWIKENKSLVVTVAKIAAAVIAGGAALMALGAAISAVGMGLGLIATVISAIGTGIGVVGAMIAAMLSPIGLVIVGVSTLAAFLITSTEAGGEALSWLGDQFQGLKDTATAAWQGIGDALAAGDIGLAARILWLTLKMEWQKGVAWLEEKWAAFKAFFVETFHQAVFAVARFLNDAWAGIQVAWLETTTFLANAWTNFISILQKTWNRFAGFFKKVWAKVKSVFGDTDAEAEIARINEEVAREDAAIQARQQAGLQGREQERQRRRQEIEQQRAGVGGELNRIQEQEKAEREAKRRRELKESEDAIAQARREWEEALAAAAKKRQDREAEMPGPAKLQKPELDLPDLEGLDDLLNDTEQKIESQGTFNPLAARGLGADTVAERTARATEQVAVNTQQLVEQAKQGRLVFAK